MAQSRSSTETDRRHLLADSLAPSTASSVYDQTPSNSGDQTPRAPSPAPARSPGPSDENAAGPSASTPARERERRDTIATETPTSSPYRGFPSEAAYLAALHEWAEEKRYVQFSMPVVGFYGERTLQEYGDRPPAWRLGLRQKMREIKDWRKSKSEADKPRRNTVV